MNYADMIKMIPSEHCPLDRAYMVSVVDGEKPGEKRLSAVCAQFDNAPAHRESGEADGCLKKCPICKYSLMDFGNYVMCNKCGFADNARHDRTADQGCSVEGLVVPGGEVAK